jgi:outer membrane biosynthesis protein TonB
VLSLTLMFRLLSSQAQLTLWKREQKDGKTEFEASLVYRVSSRTARATQRNPVSKKKPKKTKKQKKKKQKKKNKKNPTKQNKTKHKKTKQNKIRKMERAREMVRSVLKYCLLARTGSLQSQTQEHMAAVATVQHTHTLTHTHACTRK